MAARVQLTTRLSNGAGIGMNSVTSDIKDAASFSGKGAPGQQHPREHGFALLLVLWAMSLLALLGAQITGAGRTETRLSAAIILRAQLQSAADAAVYESIWHLISGPDSWPVGASEHVLKEGNIAVVVTLLDDRGKLDLNAVPPELAAAFFAVLGADRTTARNLADRITLWRTGQLPQDETGVQRQLPPIPIPPLWGPPGHDFERLDELLLVPGITETLYRAILPHAVLHLGQGPLSRMADPIVRAALDQYKRETHVSLAEPDERDGYVTHIFAHASRAGGMFTRQAELRIRGTIGNDQARYRVLNWISGETIVP
jgi:general secretion pathway protein K